MPQFSPVGIDLIICLFFKKKKIKNHFMIPQFLNYGCVILFLEGNTKNSYDMITH